LAELRRPHPSEAMRAYRVGMAVNSPRNDGPDHSIGAGRQRNMFDYKNLHSAISTLRSKHIFLIGGVMKSATTWPQVLLDSHPHISCKGEGQFPNQFAPLLTGILDEHDKYISWKNSTVFDGLSGSRDLPKSIICIS